jgi:hypothetical protein
MNPYQELSLAGLCYGTKGSGCKEMLTNRYSMQQTIDH